MSKRWELIKADIDRYVTAPEFRDVWFPKGFSRISYILKLLILLKKGGCFRVIFNYRIRHVRGGGIMRRVLRSPYRGTPIINCPSVEGGVSFSLMLGVPFLIVNI